MMIMGYIKDTEKFISVAINCLKDNIGFIHYHETCPSELLPIDPLKRIKNAIKKYNREAKILRYISVKSYAPGISHVVFDIEIGRK